MEQEATKEHPPQVSRVLWFFSRLKVTLNIWWDDWSILVPHGTPWEDLPPYLLHNE